MIELHEKNILIVDDDIINQSVIKKFLNQIGFNTLLASDGKEALDVVKNNEVHLVLLDVYMPNLDGFETCERLKQDENTKDIPIIFLTASENEDDLKNAFLVGGVDYIHKPVIKTELISRINIHLKLYEYQFNLKNIIDKQTSIIVEKSEELINKLHYDENTKLKNLLSLHNDIDKHVDDWIFLLDVNDFNVINKLYGFKFGDSLLVKVSDLLKNILSEKVEIYKLPADRFAIIVPKSQFSHSQVEEKCEKIFNYFDYNEIVIDQIITLKINFNIGVTIIKNIDTIIEAEYALDLSKKYGKRFKYIIDDSTDFLTNEKESLHWMFKTRKFIENDMIVPFFQPIIDTHTQKVYKYEALARVIDDDVVIPPFKFLDAAKKLGLVTEITKTMIKKSCEYFSNKNIGFSINITDRDLIDINFIEFINKEASKNNIKNELITIEILENITLANNDENTIFLNIKKLKDLGFQIAIDDFGSENSNFSRIIHLQANYLKIDGIFIKDIANDINKQNITLSIIQLARNLGMKSIAEFVSDEQTFNILKSFGVDYVQGFHFGKPEKEI